LKNRKINFRRHHRRWGSDKKNSLGFKRRSNIWYEPNTSERGLLVKNCNPRKEFTAMRRRNLTEKAVARGQYCFHAKTSASLQSFYRNASSTVPCLAAKIFANLAELLAQSV